MFYDPGFKNLDFSVFKDFKWKERFGAEFRVEFFNILNHANFSTPNAITFASAPTVVSGTYTAPGISSTAGVITATSTSSRQIQIGRAHV